MGLVIRKSLITTILSYLGVVIGYLNILYFFPKFLSLGQIGLYRLILDSAILLAPFAQSGSMQGIVRFYPEYQRKDKQDDFLTFSGLFFSLSVFLFSALLLLFQEPILDFLDLLFSENTEEVRAYYHLLILLIIVLSIIALFEGFERANLRIVLINFLKEVYIRLLTALSILLYFLEYLNYTGLLYSLLAIYGSTALILLINFINRQQSFTGFKLNIKFSELKEIVRYNFFMIISTGSNLVVGKIDSLMISAYLGFEENGIYTTLFYVAVVIEIPKRAISQLATPLYSKYFANNHLKEVGSLYQKSSLNQLIIGLLLYIGIITNLHNLFAFMPKGEEYEVGKWVIIIIGASRVIDMMAGSNGELIVMSKHFRFNVYAIASLALLTILTNVALIPRLGINGAAWASFISLFIFNLIKYLFIYKKLKLQPFRKQTLLVLAIGLLSFVAGWLIPVFDNAIIDLLIRSLAVLTVYSSLILLSKASEDINTFLSQSLSRLRR